MLCPTQTATGTNVNVFQRPAFNHIGFICNLIVTIAAVRESLDGATHDNNPLDTTASGHLKSVYLARELRSDDVSATATN